MKNSHIFATVLTATLLAGCSTPPPKPPIADGEITPANDNRSLNELVRAAVAASNPKQAKFSALRGEKLRDVMIRWSQQEGVRLFYQTTFNPTLTGAINEPDLRAAGVALSVLLQHETQGAVLDFSDTKKITVKNLQGDTK